MRIAQPRRAGALLIFLCVLAGAGTVDAQVAPGPDTTAPTTTAPPTTAPPTTVTPTEPPAPTTTAPTDPTSPAPPGPTTAPPADAGGPTVPTTTTVDPGTTNTTTTTTVAPGATPSTTTPTPWELAPQFDLPTYDTLEAASTMLVMVKAQLAAVIAQRDAALQRADRNAAVVADAQTELERIGDRLRNRAVNSYMAADSIFDVKINGDNTRKLLVASMETLDRNDGKSQKALRQLIATKQQESGDARAAADAAKPGIDRLTLAQKALEDKINGTVDLTSSVAPGPHEIAKAAAAADQAVGQTIKAVALADGSGPAAVDRLKAALKILAVLVQPKAGPLTAATTPPIPATGSSTAATTTVPTTTVPTTTPPGPADPADPAAAAALAAGLSPVDQLVATWAAMDVRRLQVMLFALQQTGKEYVWAAAGPDTFDCSGLVLRAFATLGVKLPHFSGSQAVAGPPVPPGNLQPTDVLSYGPASSEHITMYIGGGRVVEAKGRAYGVVVDDARIAGLAAATHIG